MKETNPFKRVLSGFLATAMMLSMVPIQEANAEALNVQTMPSTPGQKGTSNNSSYNLKTDYQNSIKISLFWAPRVDDWDLVYNNYYKWDEPHEVVAVIDGMYSYQGELPVYRTSEAGTSAVLGAAAIPDFWSTGSGLGYLTKSYDGGSGSPTVYSQVHKEGDDINQFTAAMVGNYNDGDGAVDKSAPYWYNYTEDWGVNSELAQAYLAELGYMPEVFTVFEEWHSRMYNMKWESKYIGAYNQLNEAGQPTFVYNANSTASWDAYQSSSSPGMYMTGSTARLHLPLEMMQTKDGGSSLNGTGNTNAGWIVTDNIEQLKSYYYSPFFINILSYIFKHGHPEGVSSGIGQSYVNSSLHYQTINTENLVTGLLIKDDNTEVYGEYKLMIEPVINRLRNYYQTSFSIKDTTMQYIASKNGDDTTYYHSLIWSSSTDSTYKYLANSFQLVADEPYLGVTGVQVGASVSYSDGTYSYNNDLWYLDNQFGMYIFTYPTVPIGDPADPLPTIIKTYVEIDYDEAGNIQYESDGSIKYKWAAPSTLAATLSTTNVATWNQSDTTYVVTDGVVTQQPNIHLWEAVGVYDAEGNQVLDPETEDFLTQRAYLNDVITTSVNVKSDPETTEWTGLNPTGFTYNGDVMEELWREAEVITSYSYDLLVNGDQFKGMETKEQFLAGLSIVDNYYSGNYSSESSALPISAVRDAARYSDKASAATLLAEATSGELAGIKGANFLNESGLSDHLKGYYKADQVYQTTSTVGSIDGMSGDYRYIPNTTLNYLMGFNEDGTEQVREDVRNEALTNVSNGGKPYTKDGFLDETAPNPVDNILTEPSMYGNYEYGSNVTVLRYIVGEPPEVPIHID